MRIIKTGLAPLVLFIVSLAISAKAYALSQKTESIKIGTSNKTVKYITYSPSEDLEFKP